MKIDPYFKPILISTALVVLLNTVFSLPINGAPIFTYFLGGLVAVILFKRELGEDFTEIKTSDAAILSLGTGVVVGAILTLIISINLQDADTQKFFVDAINESMKMHSTAEFQVIESLGPGFLIVTGIFMLVICSVVSLFGGLVTLPFINRAKK
ncbi:MAG: hypothetical protein OXU45_06655 [Candidatus Melainabacteria bacterium]|nr:hypothetical protein [Candidatus Melainabacteria bacterium]